VTAEPLHRPRILFVNRSYWPDVEATGQLLTELCEDLADDFDVHVLCGQPRHVADRSKSDPAHDKMRNGVTIHRVHHTQFDKASFFGRLANMLTFQAACCWRALRVPRPDVVVTETDPPFLCLLGWAVKRCRGARLVCYLQDIYPDVAVALGKLRPSFLTRRLRQLFFAAYRRAEAVVVLSRDMQELMLAGGLPAGDVQIIPNWVDLDEVFPVKDANAFRHEHGLDDKFVIMYSGNMGLSQRLEQAIDAAELLQQHEGILIAMVGDGADRKNLERRAAEKNLRNVRFFDYQPKSRLAESLSAADVHLVILRPEIRQLLMPSKIYGVLASGTASLVVSERSELTEMVQQNRLGTIVPSETPAALADAIFAAHRSPDDVREQGQRAGHYAEAHCGRARSVEAFRALLNRILSPETPPVAEQPAPAEPIPVH
jgi:glycosyltransferase involved in cell wall biosynthesis